jgi:hypothetical protein
VVEECEAPHYCMKRDARQDIEKKTYLQSMAGLIKFIIGCFILSATVCVNVHAGPSLFYQLCNDVRHNVPGSCWLGRDGVEYCNYCNENADIPGVEHSSFSGCRTDPTNKHSPLQFPAGSCRSKGFPVCCHSPFKNKAELSLANWYEPNTRCSSMGTVPCPYGGDLVQNAKVNRYHLRFTDLPAVKYWQHYPSIRRFWKHQGKTSRRLGDPAWTNRWNLDESEENHNVGDSYWANRWLNNLDESEENHNVGDSYWANRWLNNI